MNGFACSTRSVHPVPWNRGTDQRGGRPSLGRRGRRRGRRQPGLGGQQQKQKGTTDGHDMILTWTPPRPSAWGTTVEQGTTRRTWEQSVLGMAPKSWTDMRTLCNTHERCIRTLFCFLFLLVCSRKEERKRDSTRVVNVGAVAAAVFVPNGTKQISASSSFPILLPHTPHHLKEGEDAEDEEGESPRGKIPTRRRPLRNFSFRLRRCRSA